MKTKYIKPTTEAVELGAEYTLLTDSTGSVSIIEEDATSEAMTKESDFNLWTEEE